MDDTPSFSNRWRQWRRDIDLDEYETRWQRLESEGVDVHGEADFVERFARATVLDAGCGMGRVALELDRRGYEVVGLDNDPDMLDRARRYESTVRWVLGDLTTGAFDQPFDTIVMAGNVLLFVEPSRRHLVVPGLASALDRGGHLICGTSFDSSFDSSFGVADYNQWCHDAGLEPVERFATWDGAPHDERSGYAVVVHRRGR